MSRSESSGGRRALRAARLGVVGVWGLAISAGVCGGAAWSQPVEDPAATGEVVSPYEGRPIVEVRLLGLSRVDPQLVRNQLRVQTGQAYSEDEARADIRRAFSLGQFQSVDARVEGVEGGAVVVVFSFVEAPIIQDVQVVGNRSISDGELADRVGMQAGVPVDEFQLRRAVRAIEELYRNKGYFLVNVEVDEGELRESGIVLFRIREGVRVKVTDIRFEGNASFRPQELRRTLSTKTAGLFERGPVDDAVMDRDLAALVRFYQDRGFLDVRADHRVQPSPNGKEAIVTFVVDEGPLYTLREVTMENLDQEGGPLVLSRDQVVGLMAVKPGDVYAVRDVQRSVEEVRSAYWKMGYADVFVGREELRDPARGAGVVDLRLRVSEGARYRTGEVVIRGNDITRQKVVRREIQVRPDRPLDRGAVDESELRIATSNLFDRVQNPPRAAIQPEDPANPGYRDVLVEVAETNTGSLAFGVALGSDSGVVGAITLNQRNFDLSDTPESFDEMVRGEAFRGGGQIFSLEIAPGTEVQTYSANLTEPRVLDSDYSLGGTAFFRLRDFDIYDERRYGGRARFGRAFGDRWTAAATTRGEWVNLRDVDPSAPVDVFAVADQNLITGLGLELTRTSVPPTERFRPTRGTRLELGAEQAGALGGDFTFTRLNLEHQAWLAVWEDYLGRKGVLSFKTRVGYIPQGPEDTPTYERFYMGGRSFRGFDYRTISPKGIRADTGTLGRDPVGGTWLFFAGAEYEHPIWEEVFSLVTFVDSGTVVNDPGFDDYRVSAGIGIRLYIPQLGQAPLAFDFGFPLKKVTGDEEQTFSFSLDLPF